MKIAILTMISLFAPIAFAYAGDTDCKVTARSIAQMNLDQVAKIYGFEHSDIGVIRFIKTINVPSGKTRPQLEKRMVFSVEGYIYKGAYDVRVIVDSDCALHDVTVTDISPQ